LRKGFLKISPKGRGIFAFEAKMLHTHENLHNAPPTERRGLFLCSWPAGCRHGRWCVVVILFFASTDGSSDRGDLAGMGVLTRLIPKHLCKPWKHGGEAAGSRWSLTPTNVGGTSLHLNRRAPPFGELKTFSKKVLRGSRGNFSKSSPSRVPRVPRRAPAIRFEMHFLKSLVFRWEICYHIGNDIRKDIRP
jgi:hypothetical protein